MKPLLILKSNVPLAETANKDLADHLTKAGILLLGPEIDVIHLDKDGNLDYANCMGKKVPDDAKT